MSRSKHALRQAAQHSKRAPIIVLDLAMVGALAAAAAYCTWVWLSPHAKAAPAADVESRAQDVPSAAALHLFAGAAPQPASTTAVRLIGVMAPGRALFTVENGRPRTIAVGQSIGDLEVLEVHADHVVVSRLGSRQRLDLQRRATLQAQPRAQRDAGR